jgi:hypothetical protein
MTNLVDTRLEIRRLNDAFRRSLNGGGKLLLTDGITSLPCVDLAAILVKVMKYDSFTEGDDPYGEHDFGAFDHAGQRIFWKIDYYDPTEEFGSQDPADPAKTVRVLTILLADEY